MMDADPPEISGKARVEWGSNRQTHPFWSIGVLGTACWKGEPGNWGRPASGEGRGLNVAVRRRSARESDRVVGPMKPGNAGGGKGPDFWCAFEGDEDW